MMEIISSTLEQVVDRTKEQVEKWENYIDDIPVQNVEKNLLSPEEIELNFKETFEDGISNLKFTAAEISIVSNQVFDSIQEFINEITNKEQIILPDFDYEAIAKSSAISATAAGAIGIAAGGIGSIPGAITGGIAGATGEILAQVAKHNGASDGLAMTIQLGTELLSGAGILKLAGTGIAKVGISSIDDIASSSVTKVDLTPKIMNTLNQDLAGSVHPKTGIPFNSKVVELPNGKKVEGVFPEFHSLYDFQMPKEYFNPDGIIELSDAKQFKIVIDSAAKKMEVDPGFKNLFSTQQQEMFKMGILPKEFTIHHAEDIGKYQIVDKIVHANTAHHGGATLWTTR
jgi:hypothetical protein